MSDHWWWRPGWRVGRRMYTFHATFDGQPELHHLVRAYQASLEGLDSLDLIPLEWLHLTMQGIGFTDEVDVGDVDAIAEAVSARLASVEPVKLTFTRPVTDPEALQFHVQPAGHMREVRQALRAGIADVWGPNRVPDSEEWTPHVSIAYSNVDGPTEPCAMALDSVIAEPVTVALSEVQLIVIGRDERLYKWDVHSTVPLGPVN